MSIQPCLTAGLADHGRETPLLLSGAVTVPDAMSFFFVVFFAITLRKHVFGKFNRPEGWSGYTTAYFQVDARIRNMLTNMTGVCTETGPHRKTPVHGAQLFRTAAELRMGWRSPRVGTITQYSLPYNRRLLFDCPRL